MLTLFSTPKPFRGHIAVIQRNALQSWKLLHPDADVILFGVDEGTAEICSELGLQHVADTSRSRLGTNRVDAMFQRAQEISRHDLLCYCNCDIVLTREFPEAVEKVKASIPKPLATPAMRLSLAVRTAQPSNLAQFGANTPNPGWHQWRIDKGSRRA